MEQPSGVSRRSFLAAASAVAAADLAQGAQDRYQLGVMASMYSSLPLEEAMSRIRKAGYRCICMANSHAGQPVFTPSMTKPDRSAMLRRIRDLGIQPFMSLGGFGPDVRTEGGLASYLRILDLCADFEIPVLVGGGPWYFQKFPNLPKRDADWQKEVAAFFPAFEKAVRHAEQVNVTICLKPHTGITSRAKDCMAALKRLSSPRFKICWDAGNVSFYEGIYPDPDLPDLAPEVKCVALKDHKGLRGDENFPPPGQGQIDHEHLFRTLFSAGFNGPMAIERVDGTDRGELSPEVVDERLTAANRHLVPILDRVTAK